MKQGKYFIPGGIEHYQNDVLHRLNGPAIEYYDGDKQWWINGQLHRDNDLPAVESLEVKKWYQH